MLKDKNLLEDFNLVEEIEMNDAEAISGGLEPYMVSQESPIKLINETNAPVYFDLNYGKLIRDYRLDPNVSKTFYARSNSARVEYDKDFCTVGIQNQSYNLRPRKQYSFKFLPGNSCSVQLYGKGTIA